MGYNYFYKPYSERDTESKVSLVYLRTAVYGYSPNPHRLFELDSLSAIRAGRIIEEWVSG